MITKLGSTRWIENLYKLRGGGLDLKGLAKMNEDRFRDLSGAKLAGRVETPGAIITISDQAREMFEAMQENMQKQDKKDKY